jgi:hypothetical protein
VPWKTVNTRSPDRFWIQNCTLGEIRGSKENWAWSPKSRSEEATDACENPPSKEIIFSKVPFASCFQTAYQLSIWLILIGKRLQRTMLFSASDLLSKPRLVVRWTFRCLLGSRSFVPPALLDLNDRMLFHAGLVSTFLTNCFTSRARGDFGNYLAKKATRLLLRSKASFSWIESLRSMVHLRL